MHVTKRTRFRSVYLSIFFLLLYFPILAVVLYSFNDSSSFASWRGFTLKWYQELWQNPQVKTALIYSLKVGGLTALLSSFMGLYAVLASSYLSVKLEKVTNSIMMLPLLIPELALALSLLFFYQLIGLNLGIWSLVFAHSLFCVPYVYIMLQLRMKEIDKSIFEAAKDLGASSFQVFYSVLLPLVLPALLSAGLLSLAMSLDDVIISTYVSGSQSTLAVHIFSQLRVGVNPSINALCTLILVVTFTLLSLSQLDFRKKD